MNVFSIIRSAFSDNNVNTSKTPNGSRWKNLQPLKKDTATFSKKPRKTGYEKPLTDREYRSLLKKIDAKIKKLKELDLDWIFEDVSFTKESVPLAYNLLFNENISDGTEKSLRCIASLIESVTSAENAIVKSELINTVLSDEKIVSDSSLLYNALYGISEVKDEDTKDVCKYVLEDDSLPYNEAFMKRFSSVVENTTPDLKEFTLETLLPKVKTHNERFALNSDWLLYGAARPIGVDLAKQITDKDLIWDDSFHSFERLKRIVACSTTPVKKSIIDKVLSNDILLRNDELLKELHNSFSYNRCDLEILNEALGIESLCSGADEKFISRLPAIIRSYVDSDDKEIFLSLLKDERFNKNEKGTTPSIDTECLYEAISFACNSLVKRQPELREKILSNKDLITDQQFLSGAYNIFASNDEANEVLYMLLESENLCKNKDFRRQITTYKGALCSAYAVNDYSKDYIRRINSNPCFYNSEAFMQSAMYLITDIGIANEQDRNSINEFLDRVQNDTELHSSENFMQCVRLLAKSNKTEEQKELLNRILSDKKYYDNGDLIQSLSSTLEYITNSNRKEIIDVLLDDERLYTSYDIVNVLPYSIMRIGADDNKEKDRIISILKNKELPTSQLAILLNPSEQIKEKDIRRLNKTIGLENARHLSLSEVRLAIDFLDIYKKKDINEIPSSAKKELLRKLVASNADLFNTTPEIKKMFPLMPSNQEEYCAMLPSLVRSLGIETKVLNENEIKEFNTSVSDLSETLKTMTDSDFINLKISQEYDKDDFIRAVLDKTKDLSRNERQKVFDYFGFELHHNKANQTGYSITGYPVNLNNGEKLSKITRPATRVVVEELRKDVIKFSENNRIVCSNKDIEELLNKVVSPLPELRPQIGKIQGGMNNTKGLHEYDVFKHSLKVLQKIVQNPQYDKLNNSDKKVILLAALLHDITKKEGMIDGNHPKESSFDSFFIAKKFNLSQDEEIKLYTLIRCHEWLAKINSSKDYPAMQKNIVSISYDLRHDNLLDMALIFTHADLKAVKKDDLFHDKKDEYSRKNCLGEIRSFGEAADYYASIMKEKINELKKSQPILPVTKFPKAKRINEAIKTVNPDGSTNIKGVYKNAEGLIIIKYNEVENEDWEKIGFPKGAKSKGIETEVKDGQKVNTGNIKFFIHGLEYQNQLSRFDAFSLVDSDALLSVSYAERPESKYRFFRPQGVILDVDTKYIHGGGNTDAGSGYKKSIDLFKSDYLFGAKREQDRLYISHLIKTATGMDDESYIQFVNENENKSFSEIEPSELRDRIIKAFASINSNKRKGEREYNEMYISNPKPPMGVFIYNSQLNQNIGNPVEFLSEKTDDSGLTVSEKKAGFYKNMLLKTIYPL